MSSLNFVITKTLEFLQISVKNFKNTAGQEYKTFFFWFMTTSLFLMQDALEFFSVYYQYIYWNNRYC